MSDIVERLRAMGVPGGMHRELGTEAADEIERLRAARYPHHPDLYAENAALRDEIERLRAALEDIVSRTGFPDEYTVYGLGSIAERALAGEQEKVG